MTREGLRYELDSEFQQALQEKDAIVRRNVEVKTNGGILAVDVTVQAIAEPSALRGSVMIVFTDVATPRELNASGRATRSSSAMLAQMQRELEQALPASGHQPDPPAATVPPPVVKATGRIRGIDDEEMILTVVSSMLHTLRYECSVAVDGVEGCNQYVRAKADGHPFSAVLLDATIPNGISGEEALKLILAEDPDAGVTCVASVRELALR
jgi:CheY-like chemotaxis protein